MLVLLAVFLVVGGGGLWGGGCVFGGFLLFCLGFCWRGFLFLIIGLFVCHRFVVPVLGFAALI
ncbi:hypothetical protein, partial [Yersinia thracica]|uniref:hypothetical protein n=1 Tax=Yersinia thracica TaxID=2890319 RepID=UPI001C961E49